MNPAEVTLDAWDSQQFTAMERDGSGQLVPVQVTWSATGGTITESGVFTAGEVEGEYSIVATTSSSVKGNAKAKVRGLLEVTVVPSSASVPSGGALQFSARGRNKADKERDVKVSWDATIGAIDSNGVFTADGSVGEGFVFANHASGLSDTASVSVTVGSQELAEIVVTPTSVDLAPGETQQFSAGGRDSQGNPMPVTVSWSATGGTVNTAGRYTAGNLPGNFRVVATHSPGLADTAFVTISRVLTSVVVSPASVELDPGENQQYSAEGRDQVGEPMPVNVSWTATGGTITGTGLFAAGSTPGNYEVVATDASGLADTASVTVRESLEYGNLRVTASTTGQDIDPNGYAVLLDGTQTLPIGTNETMTFSGLPVGDHTVELTGIANNCSLSGENPRTVAVAASSTATTTFDVNCTDLSGRGRVTVDPSNRSWLVYENGAPFFMAGSGDPEGFLYRGSRNPDGTRNGDQLDLIDKLAPTGANSIYLMAVRSHGGDGGSTENPFVNSDPSQGLDQDILDQWETWFTAMDENGIVIFFFFYDDSADPFGGSALGSAEEQFITDIVNRFKHHNNLIWCVAEEYAEAFTNTRVSQIAAEIKSHDPVHPVAVHQWAGTTFNFANNANIDQFAVQLHVTDISAHHSAVVEAWNKANGRYNVNMSESSAPAPMHGERGDQGVRRLNWASVMGGAYVMVYGWDIANTPVSQLEQAGFIVSFMQNTRINRMQPDDSRAYGSTQWVLVETPSASFVAYTVNASAPMGVTNMEAGTYDLTWLDTITGDRVEQSGISVGAGNNTFPVPSAMSGSEVALYLRKTGL